MSPGTRWPGLQGLAQRFDDVALRPPEAAGAADQAALAGRDATTRAALLAWCRQGAGPGGAPFWQPGALPRVDQRLAVATLQGPGVAVHAWADHVARQLDGSLHLESLPGRTAALAFRLGVKARDAMWWRGRLDDDPWDAGWAIDAPAALQRLHTGFQPRRATLVLADARSITALQPGLTALRQRQADLRHPVRWLWVGSGADAPARPGPAAARFDLA